MKNRALKLLSCIAAVIVIIATLNIKVSTKQGIDYKVSTLRIPLYLKVLDFFDRHYNYQWLTGRITEGSKTDKEKAFRIFKWTHENIKRIPPGYPAIDDHVWHIIVRGFGEIDQSSDVFTTLCNYAGIDAFYNKIFSKDHNSYMIFSFAKTDKRWVVFDPYNGVYFENKHGGLVDVEEIIKGDWVMRDIDSVAQEGSIKPDVNYALYLENLSLITSVSLNRANIQSPLKRLEYEIRKWMR